jgi:hypothetical protein
LSKSGSLIVFPTTVSREESFHRTEELNHAEKESAWSVPDHKNIQALRLGATPTERANLDHPVGEKAPSAVLKEKQKLIHNNEVNSA